MFLKRLSHRFGVTAFLCAVVPIDYYFVVRIREEPFPGRVPAVEQEWRDGWQVDKPESDDILLLPDKPGAAGSGLSSVNEY